MTRLRLLFLGRSPVNMEPKDLQDPDLFEAHNRAIDRLKDPGCRKVQYFLERVREYWSPLPDLNLPADPGLLAMWPINPRWNIRIAPSTQDVETVARFLRSQAPPIRILAAKALCYSVPCQDRARALIKEALAASESRDPQPLTEAIAFLSAIDHDSPKWRTRRERPA
jgi:hypothetical protein